MNRSESGSSIQSRHSGMSSVGAFSNDSPITNHDSHPGSPLNDANIYQTYQYDEFGSLIPPSQRSLGHFEHFNLNGGFQQSQWSPPQNLSPQDTYITQFNSEDYANVTQYAIPSPNIRHTCRSLNWPIKPSWLEDLYRFHVNKGKDPWFELISSKNVSHITPLKVYLTGPG